MAEKNKESKALIKRVSSVSLSTIMYGLFKKVAAVGVIYMVGYMNWSVAWFICPIFLLTMRDHWRIKHDRKRDIAKRAAVTSEKEVILASVEELPAWVYFPDVERAEWINKILNQVWPNVNHYVRDLIRDSIEPSIRQSLANKFSGFKFERIVLGNIPPRVGGVKVYDRNVPRTEIIMDLDIFYAGDCDITFSAKGIKAGIKDLQLHGLVRVVMKPLITVMPIVGGLQVFFLNNPSIDFNLIGVADVFDLPGLSDMIRKLIVEKVAEIMVLPNKYFVKLSDVVESAILKISEPEGILRVHVVEAKHLMKKDIGMLGKGKSDPYAVIEVGAKKYKTEVINNSVDPKWDYWCEFIVESKAQELFIHLWDKDDLPMKDESLGRATLDISSVAKQGVLDLWVTLENAKHGMVHLRMYWLRLTSCYADLKAALEETQQLRITSMSTALLIIYIDSAKELQQIRSTSKPDPYVSLTVGNTTKSTSVQLRTKDPVWEQGFTFLVQNPESDAINIKIIDNKTTSSLGYLSYSLSQLSTHPNLEIDYQPFALSKSGPHSKIIMALKLRIQKCEINENIETIEDDEVPDDAGVSETAALLPKETVSSNSSDGVQNQLSEKTSSIEDNQLRSADADNIVEENIQAVHTNLVNTTPPETPLRAVHHRTVSNTVSAGDAGLGRIQLTLRYSVQRQKLIIVVHKVANLPMKDPSNIPDPYVKLYLLPDRAKDSKRKTQVIKDECNPIYDETFEYILSKGELNTRQLEVSVVTQKKLFSSGSNVMGQVIVDLSQFDLTHPLTVWLDLQEYDT